jgi:hypothetical protein
MFLSPFFQAIRAFLLRINLSLVLLLIILQLAVWYPFIANAYDNAGRQLKLKQGAQHSWNSIQQQSRALAMAEFEDHPWLQHRTVDTAQEITSVWEIEGAASLPQWQTALEQVEERFALALLSVSWQRRSGEQWQGKMQFSIQAPKMNREYHNWLPARILIERFIKKDWQLLSTMRTSENASALVEYKHHRHWVQEGSWLPAAGLSVGSVSSDQVTLIAKDGSLQTLAIRQVGDDDD